VKNFSKSIYKASSQNWSVTQDKHGITYFANNNGLLEYDGATWTLHPSPGGNIIRAVAADTSNRVFTSGYQELGYWERDKYGKLTYTSLNDQAKPFFTPNVEFWNIYIHHGKVIFQAFTQLLIYENHKISQLRFKNFTNSFSIAGERMLYNVMDLGIYEFINGGEYPFYVDNFFQHKIIRFIIPVDKEELLIGTASHGLFLLSKGKLTQWKTNENDYFIKNQINQAWMTSSGDLVIGTILDGISILDATGKLKWHFNTSNGLQNNTVLGLFVDQSYNIWIALDHGIDMISLKQNSGFSVAEVNHAGAVYAAAYLNGRTYLGTNQGLFVSGSDQSKKSFELVHETQGQVWDLKIIGQNLVIGHNSGTFLLKGDQIQKISDVSGAFSIVEDPMQPGTFFQCSYSNLVKYQLVNNRLVRSKVIYSFNDLIRFVEFDHQGNLWASHFYKGVFHLKLNNTRDSVKVINYYNDGSVFSTYNQVSVGKIENRVVFTTGDRIYTYNDLEDKIILFEKLNHQLGKYAKATRIVSAGDHKYWFLTVDFIGYLKVDGSNVEVIKEFPGELFKDQIIHKFENLIPTGNGEGILCLENGYAMLRSPAYTSQKEFKEMKPMPSRIVVSDRDGKKYPVELSEKEVIMSYFRNNLSMQFSFPFYSTDKVSFQWKVEGLIRDWSSKSELPTLNFERLPVGRYELKVKTIDAWGNESRIYSVQLVVKPPWYGSVVAIACYILLFLLALWFFRHISIVKIHKREIIKREEKEKEVIKLKYEKLQAEIEYKSKELANSTMSIINKNEFLIELKEMILHHKTQLGTRFPEKYFNELIKKIDDNISSRDDWKIFDANFEQAHEEFSRKLKVIYPELTPKDLRLCAFLRINLSSKEIAPLLGISIRGVENHRYRLRCKMNLQHDDNLIEMILNI
jgi:DNA-binding CsgD family transcriptional regulator/ligand-binding sensor domain-containing protein